MQDEPEVNYNYLDLLNPQQKAAVTYKDGPSLVIAGAGSGKTRVLTYKIVDLLAVGYEPWRILALTFTNKAAREMKERIAQVVGEKIASKLWMGTFHSIFLKILRRHTAEIGFNDGFTIYDSTDSKSLIKSILKDLNLDDKKYKPNTVQAIISNAKNDLITPEAYTADSSITEADNRAGRPKMGKIYKIYCSRCLNASAMDFDDILLYMNLLLRDYPDIRRHYQDFFKYILVDEYQDTNFAQHLVIRQLAEGQNKVCVVGDDAQSIYSFRGANIRNILNLERQFPGLKTFKLERNYRSTQNIINAANSLIKKNSHQIGKNVYSENEPGEKVHIIKTYSDLEEAALVAARITQSKLTNHDAYDDYAILYRTNSQSRTLEEALRKRNIPYRIYGGLAFYQRKEVKDAICYFRVAVNPDDDEALRRIINYPARGIGETTMKKLMATAMTNGISIFNVIMDLDKYNVPVNKGTAAKLSGFANMINEFHQDVAKFDALALAQSIYAKTGILSILASDSTPESISRQENLTELLSGLKEFVDSKISLGEENLGMSEFLANVSLATDQDQNDDNDEPKVTLMTAHASKGLEFKHITIVGAEEELFPSAMSMDTQSQIEEERRLMYVAITRAQKTCTITYAGTRFRNGQTVMAKPSRFLSDIDPKFCDVKSSNALGQTDNYINPAKNYGRFDKGYSHKPRYDRYEGGFGKSENRNSGSQTSPLNSFKQRLAGRNSSDLPKSSAPLMSPKLPPVNCNATTHTADEISIGTQIIHSKYGKGEVKNIGNMSGDSIIEVEFSSVGNKKLLLRFAKFEII